MLSPKSIEFPSEAIVIYSISFALDPGELYPKAKTPRVPEEHAALNLWEIEVFPKSCAFPRVDIFTKSIKSP